MPIVAYVGSSSANSGTTSVSPALPSGVQSGDLLIAHLAINSNGTISTPAGWTRITHVDVLGAKFAVMYKFYNSGDAQPSFTASAATVFSCVLHAFRNVKAVREKNYTAISTATTSFYPPATTTTIDDTLFVVLNNSPNHPFTPPANYTEIFDVKIGGWQFQAMYRYMASNRSQTTTDMTATIASAATGLSQVVVLEPITNIAPTLTLTSPTNNQVLSEGNTLVSIL
jgi:hypothetical protein